MRRRRRRKKRRTELFEDKRALGKILIEQCWVGRTEMLVVEEVKEEEEMTRSAKTKFLLWSLPMARNIGISPVSPAVRIPKLKRT